MNQHFQENQEPLAVHSPFVQTSAQEKESTVTPEELSETQALGIELSEETRRAQRRERFAVLGTGGVGLLLIGIVVIGAPRPLPEFIMSPFFILTIIGVIALYMPVTLSSLHRPRRVQRKLVQKLAQEGSPLLVRALIDSLFLKDVVEDAIAKRTAKRALIRLLPRLDEVQDFHLSSRQSMILRQVFMFPLESVWRKDVSGLFKPVEAEETAFRVSVLKGFALVGDEDCLSLVEKIALGDAKTEGEIAIKRTAQECLPLLKERIEGQRAEKTLLRASSAEGGGEVLLRPSTEMHGTGGTELLRPLDE